MLHQADLDSCDSAPGLYLLLSLPRLLGIWYILKYMALHEADLDSIDAAPGLSLLLCLPYTALHQANLDSCDAAPGLSLLLLCHTWRCTRPILIHAALHQACLFSSLCHT